MNTRGIKALIVLCFLVAFVGLFLLFKPVERLASLATSTIPEGCAQSLGAPANAANAVLTPLVVPEVVGPDVMANIKPEKYTSGLFWKIERAGFQPSYLLGTVHVDDPRVLASRERTNKEFKCARTVCTEVKIDMILKYKVTKAMLHTGGGNLRQDIGDDLYNKVVTAAARRKLPINNFEKFKPWAAWVVLVMPETKGESLDELIFKDAVLQDKQLCGLEDVDEHLSSMTKMPLHQQIKLLEHAIKHIDEIQVQSKQLIELYLKQDLQKIFVLMNDSSMVEDKALLNEFLHKLVVKRNYQMINAMLPHLQQGRTFFAVGALHLTGKAGLLELLESQGFKVTKITTPNEN